MNIDELLNRYFEGETSAAEERELRHYFATAELPDHLKAYRPMFAYFDEEIAAEKDMAAEIWQELAPEVRPARRFLSDRRKVLYMISAVAASVLAFLAVSQFFFPTDPCFCSDNYVVINGRCYTDIHKVRSLAFDALNEVATPADEYFPELDDNAADRQIIDNQLKELGSIFSDNE